MHVNNQSDKIFQIELNNMKHFLKIQVITFKRKGNLVHAVQIIDISTLILNEVAKVTQEFHHMANACVSHEMRNPLNAITALNISKRAAYKEI